jgi:hypothetical protein
VPTRTPVATWTRKHTAAPRVPKIGPPMPTTASIQAFRGASFSAMNAPMNGMKTGAPTRRPWLRAATR